MSDRTEIEILNVGDLSAAGTAHINSAYLAIFNGFYNLFNANVLHVLILLIFQIILLCSEVLRLLVSSPHIDSHTIAVCILSFFPTNVKCFRVFS